MPLPRSMRQVQASLDKLSDTRVIVVDGTIDEDPYFGTPNEAGALDDLIEELGDFAADLLADPTLEAEAVMADLCHQHGVRPPRRWPVPHDACSPLNGYVPFDKWRVS